MHYVLDGLADARRGRARHQISVSDALRTTRASASARLDLSPGRAGPCAVARPRPGPHSPRPGRGCRRGRDAAGGRASPPMPPSACRGAAAAHVSRGASKLIAALDHFRFPGRGIVALDIGASTGGFTQVLLERGAARVYAVDVGHGQLHARLAADPRVVSLEALRRAPARSHPRAGAGRRHRRRRELHLADQGAARAAGARRARAPGWWR